MNTGFIENSSCFLNILIKIHETKARSRTSVSHPLKRAESHHQTGGL